MSRSCYNPSVTPCVYGASLHIRGMVRQIPGFLTLKEAAQQVGMNPITLRVQIRNKRLKAVKVGRDWVVERGEWRAYLKSVGRGS